MRLTARSAREKEAEERKKYRAMRSASSEQGDNISDGSAAEMLHR